MVIPMIFNNPYWDDIDKYDLLAKWLIVHSYIYYEQDSNIVSDHMFDNNCKQFIELSECMTKKEKKQCKWYYVMNDFDGSTGFHLFKSLTNEHMNEIMQIGNYLNNRNQTKIKRRK